MPTCLGTPLYIGILNKPMAAFEFILTVGNCTFSTIQTGHLKKQPFRWLQYISPKCLYPPTSPHSITTPNAIIDEIDGGYRSTYSKTNETDLVMKTSKMIEVVRNWEPESNKSPNSLIGLIHSWTTHHYWVIMPCNVVGAYQHLRVKCPFSG